MEKKELIGRFMGYKLEEKDYQYKNFHSSNESSWEWDKGIIITLDGHEVSDSDNEAIFSFEDLEFDSDWNLLMSVVEKIESIKDNHHGYFGVYINSNSCTIQGTDLRTDVKQEPPIYYSNFVLSDKMQSTYQAVVEFIKWLNKQSIQWEN
ncbi:MAG: hypothetical protein ACJAVA_000176 [Flavobacteriaceae bacterium]|jgi:hypothetical protein